MVSPRLWRRPLTGCSFSSIRDRGDRRRLSMMWRGHNVLRGGTPGTGGGLAVKFRISRAASRNWREPCRNGRLCSLTRQGVLQPPPPGRGRGEESPSLLQMRRSRTLPAKLPPAAGKTGGGDPPPTEKRLSSHVKGADGQELSLLSIHRPPGSQVFCP